MGRDFVVFLSSAHQGLEQHRAIACAAIQNAPLVAGRFLRASMTEISGPEPLPPLAACLERVRRADAVVLVLAYRYGSRVPDDPAGRSYTEAEYDEAIRLGKPLLVFVAMTPRAFDRDAVDADLTRVNTLRKKVLGAQDQHYMVQYFGDADDFAAQIGQTVAETLPRILAEVEVRPHPQRWKIVLPDAIVHPFDGMNDRVLVGREEDWKAIDEWAANPEQPCLILQAEGGMGKSSLAWEWHKALDVENRHGRLPQRFAGKIWWSCYEVGATLRALASRLRTWIEGEIPAECQIADGDDWNTLALYLEQFEFRPFVVIDGLEAEFIGYRGRRPGESAAPRGPRDSPRAQFASSSGREGPLSGETAEDPFADFVDDRGGEGLRALIGRNLIKVLTTTRQTPEMFKDRRNTRTGLKGGIQRRILAALDATSAKKILEANGVYGSSQAVEGLLAFEAYRHPLLLTGFAAAVREDPLANGDLDAYVTRMPEIDLASMLRRDGHRFDILSFTLRGLTDLEESLLDIIATHDRPLPAYLITGLAQRQRDASENVVARTLNNLETKRSLIYSSSDESETGRAGQKRYSMHPVYRMYIGEYRSGQVQAMAAALRPEYEKVLFEGIGRSGSAISEDVLDDRIVPVIDLAFRAHELQHAWSHFHYLTEARNRFGLYRLAYDRIKLLVAFDGRDTEMKARCLIDDRETALAVLFEAGELLRLFDDVHESCACWRERARLLEGSKDAGPLVDNMISLLLAESSLLDREAYAGRLGECLDFLGRNREVANAGTAAVIAIAEASPLMNPAELGRLGALSGFLVLSTWREVSNTVAAWHLGVRLRRVTDAGAVDALERILERTPFATAPRDELVLQASVVDGLWRLGEFGRARRHLERAAASHHWKELDFAYWPEYMRFMLRIAEFRQTGKPDREQARQLERGLDEVVSRYGAKWRPSQRIGISTEKAALAAAVGDDERARAMLRRLAGEVVALKMTRPQAYRLKALAEELAAEDVLRAIESLPEGYDIKHLEREPVFGFQPAADRLPPADWS